MHVSLYDWESATIIFYRSVGSEERSTDNQLFEGVWCTNPNEVVEKFFDDKVEFNKEVKKEARAGCTSYQIV